MKKTVFATASALVLTGAMAAPALAGGLTQPTIEPAPIAPAPIAVAPVGRDWTGVYVGGQVGYGWGKTAGEVTDGALGGVHAGFDYDLGNFVIGAAADYNAAELDVDGGGQLDQMTRLGARGGVKFGDALVYATAGWANARVELDGNRSTDDGYYGGLGVDYAIGQNWTVGGEVIQHRFEDFNGTDANINLTTAQARVSYRF